MIVDVDNIIAKIEKGEDVSKETILAMLKAYAYISKHHIRVENELMMLKGKK